MIPPSWAGTMMVSTPHSSATTSKTMSSKHYSKNLTGIYLGAVHQPDLQRRTVDRSFSIPPLVRGRGQKFRVKNSTAERRNRMVELIRLKEEKRGFGGNPLRKKLVRSAAPALVREGSEMKSSKDDRDCVKPVSPRLGRSRSLHNAHIKDPYGFIRMNTRQYTAAINSGMTHFEYLVGGAGHSGLEESIVPLAYPGTDLDEMLGMEEWYRVFCKRNGDSLSALAPQSRRGRSYDDHTNDYTGFSVRSYRNPHLAELLPDFVRTETHRGGTFPCPKLYSLQGSTRPLNHHNSTNTFPRKSSFLQKYASSRTPFEDSHLRITGTGTACHYPLVGCVTHPEQKKSETTLKTGRSEYADIKRAWNSTSLVSSAPEKTKIEESCAALRVVARSMPPENNSLVRAKQKNSTQENSPLSVESQKNDQSDILSQNMEKVNCDSAVVKPTLATKKEDIPSVSPKGSQQLSPKPHAAPIISLDNEDGESKIVDIDEEELLASGGSLAASREDLSDTQENKENVEDQAEEGQTGEIKTLTTKSRSSEAIVASIKENAEQRQKDFEKLLDEHAVLVQEITRASSSDNLTQENTRE